jgi:hypothetical protein
LQLIDFEGIVKNNQHYLTWQVDDVQNVKGFEIEKSNDGIRFEKIGFVAENGTTNPTQSYAFYHVLPSFGGAGGGLYYRLKIVDNDGRFDYSKIIFLENKKGQNTIVIYPTIVEHTLIIHTFNQKIKTATIFNANGQIIQSFQNIENELNVQDLPKGVYFLALETENQMTEVKRFVKM